MGVGVGGLTAVHGIWRPERERDGGKGKKTEGRTGRVWCGGDGGWVGGGNTQNNPHQNHSAACT